MSLKPAPGRAPSATGRTSQVSQDGKRLVEKRAQSPREAERLGFQYNWLTERARLAHMPRVHRFERDGEGATLQLEYASGFVPFFDFIHEPANDSRGEAVLAEVVSFLARDIHTPRQPRENTAGFQKYLREKARGKVAESCCASSELARLASQRELTINGRGYLGFEAILDKISASRELMALLGHEDYVPVHGDPTIDNILVMPETGEFMLLDPNGENHLSDPMLDFAKLYQSLHGGYEFLCRLREVKVGENEISYEPGVSSQYGRLFGTLERLVRAQVGDGRARLAKFHEAVQYARMLPYKVAGNAVTAPAFFATMIISFNEFYEGR